MRTFKAQPELPNLVLDSPNSSFYVSYNPKIPPFDEPQTALMHEDMHLVLEGDWRQEFLEAYPNLEKCVQVFFRNYKFRSEDTWFRPANHDPINQADRVAAAINALSPEGKLELRGWDTQLLSAIGRFLVHGDKRLCPPGRPNVSVLMSVTSGDGKDKVEACCSTAGFTNSQEIAAGLAQAMLHVLESYDIPPEMFIHQLQGSEQ